MICEHCGCFFCPDSDLPDAPPVVYCRVQCRKRAANKRWKEHAAARLAETAPVVCGKRGQFRSRAAARKAVRLQRSMFRDATVRGVYKCRVPGCPWWHMTSMPSGRKRKKAAA